MKYQSSQIHQDRMQNGDCQELKEEGDGELLFNGHRILVLQDEKSLGGWLHNSVNVLDTTELYT